MAATVARIVLVGLPGAGKSTAGALAAERLGWEFVDLDVAIERGAGRTVPEIFREEGESGFRTRERAATVALRGRSRLVLAPGGGWVLEPANLSALGPGSMLVYLRVSPEVAAGRLSSATANRPLVEGADKAERLADLLRAREAFYVQANHTVTVDSLPADAVATLIVALASGGSAD